MQWKKQVAVGLAAVMLAGLTATGMAADHLYRSRPIPSNVHPALAAAVRANPYERIPVIVGRGPDAEAAEAQAVRLGAKVTASWTVIPAFAAELPAYKVPLLAQAPGIRTVMRDQPVQGQNKAPSQNKNVVDTSKLVSPYPIAVAADKVWNKGYDGTGITVAIVDSGISTHTNRSSAQDFGTRIVQSVRFNSSTNNASDHFGHGTHVAAIAGGNGAASSGKYIGIAPGINLINVKFSDDQGMAYERDLVNALQWIYDNRITHNIRVVNLSSTVAVQQSYRESPTAAAVEQLWFAGVVVVVSAGNRGGEECSVCYSPANDPYVIAVGAVDDNGTKELGDDFHKPWSSAGVTLDGHVKPDVVAPGARMVSYMPVGSLRSDALENVVDTYYFRMGGTSMAAPVVTGVVALMLQVNPKLTPDEVKWILINTARSYLNQPSGTPGVVTADAAAFYAGTPGKANQGLDPSPMLDPATGTINYSNAYWSNAYWSNAYWSNSLTK